MRTEKLRKIHKKAEEIKLLLDDASTFRLGEAHRVREIENHAEAVQNLVDPIASREHSDYSEEEEKFIIKNFKNMEFSEIADELERTTRGVRSKAGRMGLLKVPKWSEDEEEFLKENYDRMTNRQIAKVLGRSKSAVDNKAFKLGLHDETYVHRGK